jgi:aryl-alcohol dehydrogenase-like predicted oxidoreductase
MLDLQPFGRTGHRSSRVIFGAAALGSMSQDRADVLLEEVRRSGVNHIDTARGYGESEVRLRPFLAEHRAEFFLATKTNGRTADAARAELEESLDRLGVDSVDLIQLHGLVEPDEWETAHGPGGALEALVQARDEGLVRFIGITGHGTRIPASHRRALDRFDYDSVLLPYNQMMLRNDAYRADAEELLAACADRNVAVQTIKSVARRRWPDDASEPHFAWYQPLPAGDALDRAVAFVLSNPQVFLNTSSDARLFGATVAAASRPAVRPTEAQLDADMAEWAMAPLFDGAELERI